MAFDAEAFAEAYVSGDPVEIETSRHLAQMEDAIVTKLLPPYEEITKRPLEVYKRNWAVREDLTTAIKPTRYHGSIQNISVQAMPDNNVALALLLDRARNHKIQRQNVHLYIGNVIGLTLVAETSRKDQFDRGIWYIRTPLSVATNKSRGQNYLWRRAVTT